MMHRITVVVASRRGGDAQPRSTRGVRLPRMNRFTRRRGGSGAVGEFSSKQPVSKLIFSARARSCFKQLLCCLCAFLLLLFSARVCLWTIGLPSLCAHIPKWHLLRQFVYEVVACQNLVTYQTLNGVRRWPRYGGSLSSSGK